ncbi:MAG: hypothetical protein ACLSAP_08500 [Oscillospiraceae bacterium]
MDNEHAFFIVEQIKGEQEMSAVEGYLRRLHGVSRSGSTLHTTWWALHTTARVRPMTRLKIV